MAREQRCPEVERLQVIIKDMKSDDVILISSLDETLDKDQKHYEVVEALEWLKDFLLNRRNYQRKQQIKKKVMMKIINEQDLAGILDETIKAQYGDHLERFDDNTEDED